MEWLSSKDQWSGRQKKAPGSNEEDRTEETEVFVSEQVRCSTLGMARNS